MNLKVFIFLSLVLATQAFSTSKMLNYSKQVRCPSSDVREPSNYQEVVAIVQEALGSNRKIMTAAPRFSSQIRRCTNASGIQISTKNLNKIISLIVTKSSPQSGVVWLSLTII